MDYRSDEAKRYRGWYKTARWRRRRAQQLAEHPLCERCLMRGIVNDGSRTMDGDPQANARRRYLVANHRVPHRGDERLFFEGELETCCPDHHDIAVQQEERGRLVEEIDPLTGLPVGGDR